MMSSAYDEIAPDAVAPNDKSSTTQDRPLKHLDTVVALYDFPGTQPSHLPLALGDTVFVLSKSQSGWWDGVIINGEGELLRGWFPKNYARSVNYVQPVLNKLKSNKEIDSITAANTAANVLIPLFSSLLQKNLGESEKSSPSSNTRKNSVVSFASSDNSDKQTNPQPTKELPPAQQQPQNSNFTSFSSVSTFTHQQSVSTITSGIKDEDNFVDDEDTVENLIQEFRENNIDFHQQLVWNTKTTTDGNFAFYNEQLDIYTSSLPMTVYDRERDFNLELHLPSQNVILDTSVIGRQQSFSQLSGRQNEEGDNDDDDVDAETAVDSNTGQGSGRQPEDNTRDSGSTHSKEYESLKRESNASSLHSQGSTGSLYHHFSQPFYAIDGLFYSQPNDAKTWSTLGKQFNFLLDLTWKSLQESNKQLFSTHFKGLNRIVSLLFSALRLQQGDFNGKREEKSIRKRMKRVASSYASIYTNGILHLSILDFNSSDELFSMNLSRLNKSTSEPTTTFTSVSLVATVTQAAADELKFKELAIEPMTPLEGGFSKTDRSQPYSNPDEKSNTPPTPTSTDDYFSQLDHDVEALRTNYDALVSIMIKVTEDKKVWKRDYNGGLDTSDDEGEDRTNIMPQTLPRFISGEFNGGNWCNPFFSQSNPVLNASGDELKTRYHLKIIIDRDAYKSILNFSEGMKKLSEDTLKYLDPDVQHNYFNEQLKLERNTQILRLIYKYLYYAGLVVDILEAFDFTVFCLIKRNSSTSSTDEEGKVSETGTNTDTEKSGKEKRNLNFDYPVVLEFFEYKQRLHNLISEIVMATQQLSLEDPEVFKGMKEEDPLIYNRDIMRDPKEKAAMLLINIIIDEITKVKGDSISLNPDKTMLKSLTKGIEFIDNVLTVIQQLIEERETILNYATRVMHDDFNVQLLVIERNNTILSDKSDESQYYENQQNSTQGNSMATGSGMQGSTSGGTSTPKRKSNDTPWFLEGDDEFDLLLDLKGNIKGGSKEALVSHLTHHENFYSNFNSAFLVTFSTFMTLGELINLLILRFNIEAPEGLSYEEYNTWINKKQNPIRLRVLTVMKLLIEKYWCSSFFQNKSVIKKWLNFVQSQPVQHFGASKTIATGLLKVLQGESVCIEKQPIISLAKPPASIIKSSSLMKKLKLLDIDYIELARQLTLREFNLYSKINRSACIMKVWGRKSGLSESFENITNFIKASNQLTNYVAYMILRKQDIKKRVQLIRYFVQVAEKCRQYNNYSSMTAIISALYSSPIHRLKKTWKFVSTDTLAHLQNMNKLMNSTRNFNEYRDVLKFIAQEPCVPFFGVFLSDLTFVFHGNLDYLMNRPRMINFAKRAKTFEIVSGVDRFKINGYNFQEVKEIQQYLNNWFDKCPTIDEQYQLSLNLEPREAVKLGGNFRKR